MGRKTPFLLVWVALILYGLSEPAAGREIDAYARWTVGPDAVTGAFEVRAERLPDAPGRVRRYRLAYPSGDPHAPPPDDQVPAELYLPADEHTQNPTAAVVILHILNGNYEFERLIAGELARHGIAALWFKLPHYDERRERGERLFNEETPERLIDVFERGALDVRRAFDLLIEHREIDGARIGIAGLSMGGIVAVYAASQETRNERLALIMAGGGLVDIVQRTHEMRHLRAVLSRRGPEAEQAFFNELNRLDPLRVAEDLRSRLSGHDRIRMINAAADEVIPEHAARALAKAFHLEDKIVWLPGVGHYTISAEMPTVLEQVIAFWDGSPAPYPVSPADPPLGVFAEQLGILVTGKPTDTAYTLEAAVEARVKNGRKYQGRVSWRQGPNGKFRLDAVTGDWGRISIGQADRPWVWMENTGMRMDGTDPVQWGRIGLPAEWDVYRRVAGETLRYGSRIPQLIQEQLRIQEEPLDETGIRMNIEGRRVPGRLVLDWACATDTVPHSLTAYTEEGTFLLRDLSLSTAAPFQEEDFTPPASTIQATLETRDLLVLLTSLLGIPLP